VADIDAPAEMTTIDAFGTPTIVHFGAVLLISGIFTAPWTAVWPLVLLLAILGAAGIVYTILVARRARKQSDYKPVLEDWIFHVCLPSAAYIVVLIAAFLIRIDRTVGLFALAAVVLLLLFIGIHNAWDTVTYMIVERRGRKKES